MMRWLVLLSAFCIHMSVWAAYPERPITVIVGFPPGSAPDLAARLATQKLGPRLGQPIVVENRPGAAGTIGTAAVARAEPDGYTLLLGSASGLTVGPALHKNLSYDPVKSFAPIIQMLHGAFILSVRSGLPITDLKGLIAEARANPGKLMYGSSGNGSLHHLCMEMLKSATGIDITHVPYKGSPPNWLALNNGEVDLICDSMPNPLPTLQSGKARAIAITGERRLDLLPQVATFKEQGVPQVRIDFWYGFLAPAGTPAHVLEKLNAEFAEVFKDPELVKRYAEQGIELTSSKPEDFGRLIARETREWAEVVGKTGARID